MILGLGALVAGFVCPPLFDAWTKEGKTDFQGLFLIPCLSAAAAAVALALFFHPPKISGGPAEEKPLEP